MKSWFGYKNILVIRPDNMGDLIMSGPAIRALKESFGCKITVLTSSMAVGVVKHMPEIDDAIIFDMPWVKTANANSNISRLIENLKARQFDATVIFTVYSQSALPSAMLAYQARISQILAYCRENPYGLINNWVPDKEPYEEIKHQVKRDLDLVESIGAFTKDDKLQLKTDYNLWNNVVRDKLIKKGINSDKPWLILHPGVSELKREYPVENWVATAKKLINTGYQVLFTGSAAERELTDQLQQSTGKGSYSLGGYFKLDEFICLIKNSALIISVNTGTVHIAAAVGTPVVVLYAQTNPQHTPWQVPHKVLEFSVAEDLRSKNPVIKWVNQKLYNTYKPLPQPDEVIAASMELLSDISVKKPASAIW